jgi:hypothetical protein
VRDGILEFRLSAVTVEERITCRNLGWQVIRETREDIAIFLLFEHLSWLERYFVAEVLSISRYFDRSEMRKSTRILESVRTSLLSG